MTNGRHVTRIVSVLSVALPVAAGVSVLSGTSAQPRFLVFTPVALVLRGEGQ